jgi:mannitol/fructose-specific phosphotransferase system IIA component (Ntr-type)
MEIILGLLALEAGLIGERLFVALVVMALVTSITSGGIIDRILGRPKPVRFWAFASGRTFVPEISAHDRFAAVEELAGTLAESGVDAAQVAAGAIARERVMGSGIGGGVAVPHARVPGLAQPLVAVGRSTGGIDFRSPDGTPARLVVLLVTPAEEPTLQLRLLASVAETCQNPQTVGKLVETQSWTEFLAVLNAAGPGAS